MDWGHSQPFPSRSYSSGALHVSQWKIGNTSGSSAPDLSSASKDIRGQKVYLLNEGVAETGAVEWCRCTGGPHVWAL